MKNHILYSCYHAGVKDGKTKILSDISLAIQKGEIISFISEDDSSSSLLKLVAGLLTPCEGNASYSFLSDRKNPLISENIQYAPDHIVHYSGLTVAEFLTGISRKKSESIQEANRLLSLFKIDTSKQLLYMTYEANRLVGLIQAMMTKPMLLLLDRPYHMLEQSTYKTLLKELLALHKSGTAILLSSQSYRELQIPCHRYIFLHEGKCIGSYNKKQLPSPAKVITLQGGTLSPILSEKTSILSQNKHISRLLSHESDMCALAAKISRTNCRNFYVDDLSMEEELFENYEKWML